MGDFSECDSLPPRRRKHCRGETIYAEDYLRISRGVRLPDRGLGDTVRRILQTTGLDGRIKRILKFYGIGACGCHQRRLSLNSAIPYDISTWKSRIVAARRWMFRRHH